MYRYPVTNIYHILSPPLEARRLPPLRPPRRQDIEPVSREGGTVRD